MTSATVEAIAWIPNGHDGIWVAVRGRVTETPTEWKVSEVEVLAACYAPEPFEWLSEHNDPAAMAEVMGRIDFRNEWRFDDALVAAFRIAHGTLEPSELEVLRRTCADLRGALGGLGVTGGGYCWCATKEQAAAGHTGECKEAAAAMGMTEMHENLQNGGAMSKDAKPLDLEKFEGLVANGVFQYDHDPDLVPALIAEVRRLRTALEGLVRWTGRDDDGSWPRGPDGKINWRLFAVEHDKANRAALVALGREKP